MVDTENAHEHPRLSDRVVVIMVVLASLALYLTTICPTVFWYDSAEYATAAALLGIPHPPGYPLYTLLGRLFVFLPVEPALALNLLSALSAAAAVGLTWTLIRTLGGGRLGAWVGAATLATGQVFWSQALIAEVYTPALLVVVGVTLLLVLGLQRRRPAYLILAGGLSGLGLGIHLSIATCGLGFAILVLGLDLDIQTPRDLRRVISRDHLGRRAKIATLALLAALGGSAIFLYLPLRAAMKPALNFGDVVTWDRFAWMVTGGNYKGWFLHDYDVLARALKILTIFYDQLLVVGVASALYGIVVLLRRVPLAGAALLLMAVGNITMFFGYRVHDVEVFFLPTVLVTAVAAGFGAEELLKLIADASGKLGKAPLWTLRGIFVVAPVLMGVANYHVVDLSHYTAARKYGERLSRELPRDAILLHFTTPPEWKNQAVFGHYFQKVLKVRPDVKEWHPRSPKEVLDKLRAGRAIYLYYPVSRMTRFFVIAKEGALFRVLRPRRPPHRG